MKCRCSWMDEVFCDYHKPLDDIYEEFIKNKKLKYIGEGCSRKTYSRGGKYVYKFPFNSAGIRHNKIEALAYKNRQHVTNLYKKPIGKYLARCVLLKNNILRMEKLREIGWHDDYIEELEDVDCNQGGLDKNKKWKIYDYSVEIKIKGVKMVTPYGLCGEKLPKIKGLK